jgi:AcrR family transcriptional regulator
MTVRAAGLGLRPRSNAREKTRELVIQAALRLFSERGYLGVRVEDIAREAGVSRATFYKHFAEREQILAALLSRLLGSEQFDPSESGEPARDVDEKVHAVARRIVERMLEQEELARFVYSLPFRHDTLLHEQQAPLPSAFQALDRVLEAAVRDGQVRQGIPADVLCAHVHGAIETAMRDWATARVHEPYERLEQHLDLALHGALTSPGKRPSSGRPAPTAATSRSGRSRR